MFLKTHVQTFCKWRFKNKSEGQELKVKNEIQQRRIPSSTGGGTSVIDASYNPLSTNEDYFFPQTAEGRGSKVETLPGGTNLGEITDLKYFTNKLFRALRIPASYLPTSVDEQANTVSDGKVGTAYIQELRFNRYCERLQSNIVESFDHEFKFWLSKNGYNIDPSLFELKFNPPQNFAAYRQAELDTTRANIFGTLQQVPHLSKRFALKLSNLWCHQQSLYLQKSLGRELPLCYVKKHCNWKIFLRPFTISG